jgi:hypothetical protein
MSKPNIRKPAVVAAPKPAVPFFARKVNRVALTVRTGVCAGAEQKQKQVQ